MKPRAKPPTWQVGSLRRRLRDTRPRVSASSWNRILMKMREEEVVSSSVSRMTCGAGANRLVLLICLVLILLGREEEVVSSSVGRMTCGGRGRVVVLMSCSVLFELVKAGGGGVLLGQADDLLEGGGGGKAMFLTRARRRACSARWAQRAPEAGGACKAAAMQPDSSGSGGSRAWQGQQPPGSSSLAPPPRTPSHKLTHLQHRPWDGVGGQQVRKELGCVAQLVRLQPAVCLFRGAGVMRGESQAQASPRRAGAVRAHVCWRAGPGAVRSVAGGPTCRLPGGGDRACICGSAAGTDPPCHPPVDQLVLLHEGLGEAVGVLALELAEALCQQGVVPAVPRVGVGSWGWVGEGMNVGDLRAQVWVG